MKAIFNQLTEYAKRGETLVLMIRPGTDTADLEAKGIMVNRKTGEQQEVGIQQALKMGYWEIL
jgi:hypothetical protein